MASSTMTVVCLLAVVCCTAVKSGTIIDVGQFTDDEIRDIEDVQQIIRIISKPRSLPMGRLVGFSWSDCGGSSSVVRVTSVSVTPDPLNLPGNVTLSFSATVAVDLGNTIAMDITLKKKIAFVWIEIPCIDNIGSCSYDNICPTSTQFCPPPFTQHGIPCQCPVKRGAYNLPPSSFMVDVRGAPSGEYRVSATLHSGSTSVGCLNVDASIG